ncbi:uncharacterized protein TM35_000024510 [Trypanosoma theileri]|uniref:C3H1-type domain-containing protein n=1 Tax=Trypanosoma theileri TaxID=67003 RepID=A0A1X0P8G5_9TRYP|nr:uncharacterized protein TM35_000024510 [Trypanosoma theileri]ORC93125.1 hypothetical protein TM35_000024510 [Trypanosoma theileri]
MFAPEQHRHRFSPGGYSNSAGSGPQFMMMYSVYPKTNGASSSYMNQHPVAANPGVGTHPAVYQYPLNFPVVGFGGSPGVAHEEEETEGTFEVHDSHLKAPITLRPNVVFPSAGSQALFGGQRQPTSFAGRNAIRICESFQEGRCTLGENCADIHVYPEYLNSTRQAMIAWLQSKEREFQQTLIQDPRRVFRVFCADLKEVVEVPISALRFTKGLYVDPTLRARRARGGHQNQFAIMASQVPTACGLFSVEPSQCKWGRWCNQVHIEQTWMQSKKSEFESWSNGLENRFNDLPPDHLFTVHDPQLKMSLKLPKASIAGFSRGLFQGSAKKAPSVCMLFQRNRCTASACCNQIHVVPAYLQLHRRWVQSGNHISEQEREELAESMNVMLQSLTSQRETENLDSSDPFSQSKELNPKALPYVPTPPPMADEKSLSHADESNTQRREKDQHGSSETFLRQSGQLPSSDNDAPMGQEDYTTPVRTSGIPNHRQQQQQRYRQQEQQQQQQQQFQQSKSSSLNESGTNSSRNQRSNSSGLVLPLGEFVVVVDTDDRSQSSLQASQGNISHAGKSYRHTNNPYALGGNSSCTASPSFGWVQPVRSAGNSITTFPNGGSGGGGGANSSGSGPWGSRGRADSSPGVVEVRPTFLGFQHHEMDGSLHISSSSSLHWNASGSTITRALEEFHKPTTEMDSPRISNGTFFGHC